jgi:hypothetical protein
VMSRKAVSRCLAEYVERHSRRELRYCRMQILCYTRRALVVRL